MPPSFNPFLINDPSGDPGLFVPFSFQKRAFIFDLGDIHRLSPREILKISHIFVSHTHMDHFAGFDRVLRIMLGREKTLYVFGPDGFLANIEGKLAGYSWNLVKNFSNELSIHATEIRQDVLLSQKYHCREGFKAAVSAYKRPFCRNVLQDETALTVFAAILDHGIPSICFSLKEKFRVNVRKESMAALGLIPGPWLFRLKQAILESRDADATVEVPCAVNSVRSLKKYKFKDLVDRITIITEGQKVGYVADASYTPANVEKIIDLCRDADHLFIESAFLEKDLAHAQAKHHLTARQAGEIAGLAGAGRFTLFHFSPRYQPIGNCAKEPDAQDLFYEEAMAAYQKHRVAVR